MFTASEIVVLLVFMSATASGYFVSIDAHADECFHERVNSGTKMGLMFEVAEGGFLDIDVEVRLHLVFLMDLFFLMDLVSLVTSAKKVGSS